MLMRIDGHLVSAFKLFIGAHDCFFIAGHKEPDGDCIASALGVEALVKAMGKNSILVNAGGFNRPEVRPYETRFTTSLPFLTEAERSKAGVIIVDCSEGSRIGDLYSDISELDTFIIDHHRGTIPPEAEGASIIDPLAPAASLLVFELYQRIIGFPDTELANIFFLGLACDTGYFRYLGEDDDWVFTAARDLVRCGVNPRHIHDIVTGGKTFNSRKLLGILLGRTTLYIDGALAVTYETMDDTARYDGDSRDSDLLYSALLSVEGIKAVAFIRQETITSCTAGLRSRDDIDCASIARALGGGGHKNAAGLSTQGTIDTLTNTLVKLFAKAMQQ